MSIEDNSDTEIAADHAANWPMYFTGIAALSLCAFDIPVHGPASLFLVVAFAAMFAIPFWLVFADVLWFYRFITGWIFFFGLFPIIFRNAGFVYIGLVIFFLIMIYRILLVAGFELYQLDRAVESVGEEDRRHLRHQFTLKDIFFVTIVVGVSAGLIRLGLKAWPITPDQLFTSWTFFTAWITIIANLYAFYTMLRVKFSLWRMFAGILLAIPWLFLQTGTIDYWKVISFVLGYTICLFFFAILRASGYRWVWTGV